jgi:hypothetical protein
MDQVDGSSRIPEVCREGVFEKIWVRLLQRYDEVRGIRL